MLGNLSHFLGYVLWGEGDCIQKRKKTDRQYQALDQVYQFIKGALLGVFRILDIWVKKLTGNTKIRGKINGGEHV